MKTWFLFPLSLIVLTTSNSNATWNGSNSYQLSCDGEISKELQEYCYQGTHQNQPGFARYLKIGAELERKNKFSDAVAVYESGLKAHPGNEELLRRYSLAKSNHDEAEYFSSQETQNNHVSLKDDSKNVVKCKTEKAQSAIQACQLVLQENPLRTDIFEPLGDAFRSTARPEEALWAYEKALELDKNNSKLALKRMALVTITGAANDSAITKFATNSNSAPNYSIAKSAAPYQESLIANTGPTKTIVTSKTDDDAKSELVNGDGDLISKMKLLITLHTDSLISDDEFKNRKQALLDSVVDVQRATPGALSNSVSQMTTRLHVASTPLEFGSFHALVIGNNRYEHLPSL
ncbi:MAG: hypothetical protein OER96_10750, partial [Gammaproteobacteria bacterium]|nr:hypothetical protein [Gammaproteobacteria bacterium]